MALETELLNAATSVADVAQVAEAAEKLAPWASGLLGMGVVLTALISIWVATALVGTFFNKKASSPGKTEAAPKAQSATAAAPAAAAANDIPLAVIIAAAVQMVQAPIRNVVVSAPGMESIAWTTQGRQTIYASHMAKAPQSVTSLGTIRHK
ncbi:MAG: OadG family protein [Rhodospirillaceae bacterium]|nr:OadG family protein [Rhodospirillaceae bacterium]